MDPLWADGGSAVDQLSIPCGSTADRGPFPVDVLCTTAGPAAEFLWMRPAVAVDLLSILC